MSKMAATKTNFTAGELSPELAGRGDLTAYANGARRLRNVFIAPAGGVFRRHGLAYVDSARGPGRLASFEFNTEQTYLLVFTHGFMDVYADGAHVAELATPWTGSQINQISWTQSADTLLVVHPEVEPRKITRTSHSAWTIAPWSFHTEGEVIWQPYHKFAAPLVTVSPSGNSGTIIVNASAAVFAPAMAGRRLRIGGKEVLITSVNSATQIGATVKQTLTSTATTEDWEEEAFSPLRGWPVSVCFHQDRLVIGGGRDVPNRLFLSKSSDLFNFDLGTGLDDEAIEFSLLSDQVNAIRAVFSGHHLQVFTSGAEWMVSGEPLTPTKIQLNRQTRVGSPIDRWVPPRNVDGATLFASRDGRDLREFLFADMEQAYQATDLAMLAKHLVNRPRDMDYDPGRRLFHVVMDDGSLATMTVYRAEQVTAWSRQETDGAFRSVAVVDGEVFLLVERQGAFLIERFDASLSLDSALSGNSATAKSTWSGLEHLEGRTVTCVADSAAIATVTVSGGEITLDEPALAVTVGLPFTHCIEPLPPSGQGSAPGTIVRLIKVSFRLLETQALHVDTGRGIVPIPFRRFGRDRFGAALDSFSGDIAIRAIGWKRDPNLPLWRIEQDTPLPCVVLAVATDVKYGE